jgi:double-stranded uracil-DNA glycosylase
VGHHFAKPGNRFWRALHGAGFTDRLLSPTEERELLAYGYGITNLVERTTARAADLRIDELREGARRLHAKAERFRPEVVAILGIEAFRRAFDRKVAAAGKQPISVGPSAVWVLPNPSGLNAHYQLDQLVRHFALLRESVASPS